MPVARSRRPSLPRPLRAAVAVAAAALLSPLAPAAAQTIHPAFQVPRIVPREYNFAVVDADGGTGLLAQWHEGMSANSAFRFDAGLIDRELGDVHLVAGATYLRDLNRATAELPIDMLLTVGGHTQIGEVFWLEIPVGVSLGRRFPLEGALAITPFVHPRAALQYARSGGASDTDLGIAFDIGGDLEVSSRLSLRAAFTFGDADAIGIGLAWRPAALGRR